MPCFTIGAEKPFEGGFPFFTQSDPAAMTTTAQVAATIKYEFIEGELVFWEGVLSSDTHKHMPSLSSEYECSSSSAPSRLRESTLVSVGPGVGHGHQRRVGPGVCCSVDRGVGRGVGRGAGVAVGGTVGRGVGRGVSVGRGVGAGQSFRTAPLQPEHVQHESNMFVVSTPVVSQQSSWLNDLA